MKVLVCGGREFDKISNKCWRLGAEQWSCKAEECYCHLKDQLEVKEKIRKYLTTSSQQ